MSTSRESRSAEVPLRYGLLLFPQWELLDAAGPIEALNSLTHSATFPYASDLDFCIIAETLDPVSTAALSQDPKPFNTRVSQSVVPTHTFADAPEIDVLIIPGGYGTGPGALHAGKDGWEPNVDAMVDFIARMYEKVEYVITVCSGSGLIARAGLLDGHTATTNKAAWKAITPLGPKTHWVGHARWVVTDQGKIWTSSGVTAGMDCFLAFLEEVYGTDEKGVSWADQVSAGMEYTRARDSKADPWAEVHGVQDVSPKE